MRTENAIQQFIDSCCTWLLVVIATLNFVIGSILTFDTMPIYEALTRQEAHVIRSWFRCAECGQEACYVLNAAEETNRFECRCGQEYCCEFSTPLRLSDECGPCWITRGRKDDGIKRSSWA